MALPSSTIPFVGGQDRFEEFRVSLTDGTSIDLEEGFLVSLEFVKEFRRNDASLRVLRIELTAALPIVVVIRPVLERNVQVKPWLPLRPVAYYVPPRVRLCGPCPIGTQNGHVRDDNSQKGGRGTGLGPLGSDLRREGR